MKLVFNTVKISSNPKKAFQIMETDVTRGLKRKEQIDETSFYAEISAIGEAYTKNRDRIGMFKNSKRFAETLVNLGNGNLAGIIYSVLIKLNKNNPIMVEELATNGLAIAKRFKDDVHIMARADDLVKVYTKTEFGSDRHIKMLYTVKRALSKICNNYDNAREKYNVISRKMKPVETYEKMLAGVKIEIAEVIMRKQPKEAVNELLGSKELLEKYGEGPNLTKINNLLKKLT